MKNIKSGAFLSLLAIGLYVVYLILTIGIQFIGVPSDTLIGVWFNFLICMVLTVFMFCIIKTTKVQNCITRSKLSEFVYYLLLLLLFIVLVFYDNLAENIVSTFKNDWQVIVLSILGALTPAIFEEMLGRGVAMQGMLRIFSRKKYQLLYASLLASAIFGLIHLSNLTFQSYSATYQQVFYAFSIGMVFSVILIRTNRIEVLMIIHFLLDLQPDIVTSGSSSDSWLLVFTVFSPLIIVSTLWLTLQKGVNS